MQTTDTAGGLVDWNVAVATAHRVIRPGPNVPRREAELTVQRLRTSAVTAEGHVRRVTELDDGTAPRPADVVDRPGWVSAAAEGLEVLTSSAGVGRSASRAAGVQAGLALALLGSRVLGQYDPFGGRSDPPGRLLLIAPNVVGVQQALRVADEDFQMWVCLHEVTHRLQFSAVPWLRDYFRSEVQAFLDGAADPSRASELLSRLPDAVRNVRREGVPDGISLFMHLQPEEQRRLLDRLIALATLLEGHADYVMDAVGPTVVPSVAKIRRKFNARRTGGGLADRLLRAVLGMEAKFRQYAEGAAFTRQVIDAVGMRGFNAVWTSPETLPSRSEIAAPSRWLDRVHSYTG